MSPTPWYATREAVTSGLDTAATSLSNAQVDAVIASASRAIDGDMRRVFYPTVATRYFDWLDHQFSYTWQLWLDDNELAVPPTSVLAAGVDITAGIIPRSFTGDDRPPYMALQTDLSKAVAFTSGFTFQKAIAVTGLFGYQVNESAAGTLGAAVASTSTPSVTVTDTVSIGVGSLLRVDSERMQVTGRTWGAQADTLGTGGLAQAQAANLVPVTTPGQFQPGEPLLIDGEQLLVDSVAGANLVVRRAMFGTPLAAHTAGAAIYRSTALTVARGVLGTTAATHLINAPVLAFAYPEAISDLCVAEAMIRLGGRRSGYANVISRGEVTKIGTSISGIDELRTQARQAHRRKMLTYTPGRPM